MPNQDSLSERINRGTVLVLLVIMAMEMIGALFIQQWLTAFLVVGIMLVIAIPFIYRDRLPVKIPMEIHVLSIVFIFASLFLGEVQSFYQRVWWWDIALHGTSGLLLGVLGFLLVYVLNESERVEMYLRPQFVAFFAFLFALAVGALWELLEFGTDQWFGTNMQKPMFDDPSGLTDTMWDLLMDMVGALFISVMGWWYLSRQYGSLMERWIAQFVASNPKLFLSRRTKR